MELIGLLGHQGVGKNYFAEVVLPQILPKKNTVVLAFADHFKVDCICKHNANYDKVFGEKDFETRRLLQLAGTEQGRNKFGYDIWIRTLETWIKILNSRGVERFIISDVRFQNEADWVKSFGGSLIKIESPIRYNQRLAKETNNNPDKINEIKAHASEVNIDKISNYDICINNDPGNNINDPLNNFFTHK